MKVLFGLLIVSMSASSIAAVSSIYDLQYLPEAGTVFGSTGLYALRSSDTYFDGTVDRKSRSKGLIARQSVGYSISNNLTVEGLVGYSDTKNKTSGSDSTNMSGLNNIGLRSKFRLINEENRLDLIGGVSISPDDDITKSNGDMNAYSGGHSASIALEYGVKKANHQWSFSAEYEYSLKATSKDKSVSPTRTTKDDAHSGLAFQGNLLTQVAEMSYIKTSAGVNFVDEYEDNDNGTTPGSSYYTLGAEFQQVLSKDLFLGAGFNSMIAGNGSANVVMLYNLAATYQF